MSLLLFGCLFQIYVLHGIVHAFASVGELTRVSGVSESKRHMTIGNDEWQNHVKRTVMSSGRRHNTLTGIRRSVVKKQTWNKIIHTGFHNGSLQQEPARKRQVSFCFVAIWCCRSGKRMGSSSSTEGSRGLCRTICRDFKAHS